MATYVGPLLLVLVGAGGLLVVFGRRLPDLRGHLALAARSAGRTTDIARGGRGTVRAARLLRALRVVLRGVVRVLMGSGRMIARILKRPPVTLRVPRIAVPSVLRWHTASAGRVDNPREHLLPATGAADETPPAAVVVAVPAAPPEPVFSLREKHENEVESIGEPPQLAGTGLADGLTSRAALMEAAAARAEQDREVQVGVLSPLSHEAPSAGVRSPRPPISSRSRNTPPGRKPSVRARRGRVPSLPVVTLDLEEGNLEEAAKLLKDGQLARAEAALVDALAENPRDLNAYRLLGQLYLQRDDFVQAREVLEEALRRAPQQTTLYGLLGRTYFGLGKYGKALQLYQRAHDTDERNLEYLERLLLIASRMDRRPLVKVTAEKILALEPSHAEAKKHLARVAAE